MKSRRAPLARLTVSSLLALGLVAAATPANAVSSFSGSYYNPKGKFGGVASYSNSNKYWGITDYGDGYNIVAKLQRSYQGSGFYTYSTKSVSDGRAPSWYNPLPSGGSGRIEVCFYDSNWNATNNCDYVYTQLN